MANKPMSRDDLEKQIITKVWKDPEFRNKFLADPKGVVQAEIQAEYPDVKLPGTLKINIVEEKQNEMTIVLPVNPADLMGKEISDEELEAVAGGTILVAVVVAAAAVIVVQLAAAVNVGANTNVGYNVNMAGSVNVVA